MDRSPEPYLRAAPPEGTSSQPCPPGWVAEPVGLWDGRHQEVVYHPRRHDVLIMRGPTSPAVQTALPGAGWSRTRETDGSVMWVRDRVQAARDALQRIEDRPSLARTLGRSH